MALKTTILVLIIIIFKTFAFKKCNLHPKEFSSPRSRNGDRYIIEIDGQPEGYVPGRPYTVNLKINPFLSGHINKFRDFIITVEPLGNALDSTESEDYGQFHLIDKSLTKFSENCKNTVVQTNTVPKKEIQVIWVAPPTESGCIKIVAMVKVNRKRWYGEEGSLVKILCELPEENEDTQPKPLGKCCTCDEAKYEIAFKGMWSRNTHPNHFPDDLFSTKFSELVGASHKKGHAFWSYNQMANEGLKVFAETGNTKVLENELKENIENIRTIIKARELAYPHLTGTTYTVFRVDRKRHLVSVVSKITPSPDWIVGVSNLELCLKNCSWVEQKVLNLYPYDVGTDDGITYTSPDQPSDPPQPIRRISKAVVDDVDSPFYVESDENIKPFARIYLTRQKVYEKTCEVDDEDDDEGDEEEKEEPGCPTTKWSDWSQCINCFMTKSRSLLVVDRGNECSHVSLEKKKSCPCEEETTQSENERCATTEWSEWSTCSATCGKGTRTRDREFLNPDNKDACIEEEIEYEQNEECDGTDCADETIRECPTTVWGEWSPCSVTCGSGFKERYMMGGDDKDERCRKEVVECIKPPCEGEEGEGDEPTEEAPQVEENQGNEENEKAETPEPVEEGEENSGSNLPLPSSSSTVLARPVGVVIDCKVSRWSEWSECDAKPCKKGYKTRHREIIRHPSNGGAACPAKLQKRKRCRGPCELNSNNNNNSHKYNDYDHYDDNNKSKNVQPIDCIMSKWSAWSPCTANCGPDAIQIRTRTIISQPNKWGTKCGPTVEEKSCHLPYAC